MSFAALLETVEKRPYYAARLLLHVGIVAGVRALWQQMATGEAVTADRLVLYYAWYLYLATAIALILSIVLERPWRRFVHVATYGIVLGLVPPLAHQAIFRGADHHSQIELLFFEPATFLRLGWPDVGEFVAMTGGVLLINLFVWLRGSGRHAAETFSATIGYYAIFVVAAGLGAAADGLVAGPLGESFSDRVVLLALLFLVVAFGLYVSAHFRRYRRSLTRVAHALPWFWTVLIASRYGGGLNAAAWFLAMTVLILHVAIIMANDYYDRDEHGGSSARLDGEDALMINAFTFALAVLFSLRVPVIGALLMVYVVSTLAYHHDSTRLKHVCPLNYKIEGIVGGVAFLVGLLAARSSLILDRSDLLAMFFAFGGFAVVSMFKDYKDIDEDRERGVKTIYVVLERRGWSREAVNRLVALIVGVALLTPFVAGWFSWLQSWVVAAALVFAIVAPVSLLYAPDETTAVRRTLLAINAMLALVALG